MLAIGLAGMVVAGFIYLFITSAPIQNNSDFTVPKLEKRVLDMHAHIAGTGSAMPLIKTGLTSPLFHSLSLSFDQLADLMKTVNSWDRDVKLKMACGVPEELFTNSWDMLMTDKQKRRN